MWQTIPHGSASCRRARSRFFRYYAKTCVSCRDLAVTDPSFLQLNDEYSSLVWSTTPALASRLCTLPGTEFAELVNVAFSSPWVDVQYLCSQIGPDGQPLANFMEEASWGRERRTLYDPSAEPAPPRVVEVQDRSRAAFPLRLRNSEHYVKSRVALIGCVTCFT